MAYAMPYQLVFITKDMVASRLSSVLNVMATKGEGAKDKLLFMLWCTVVNIKNGARGIERKNASVIINALEMAQIMILLDAMPAAKSYILSAEKAIFYDFELDMVKDIMKRRTGNQNSMRMLSDIGILSQLPNDIIFMISDML